jgi:hypothetical protein
MWEAARGLLLYGWFCYASIRHLTDPYDVLRVLEPLAGEIGALFAP